MEMEIITQLQEKIGLFSDRLDEVQENDYNKKISPGKWSKKEILGHLCDSATNNYVRFMNILSTETPIEIQPYFQNQWVSIHNYQESYTAEEVKEKWRLLNRQFLIILRTCDADQLNKKCLVNGNPETFGWLVKDYTEHMEHHMKQIFK